jgi:diaminopimelate decarboxylase
MDTPKKPAKEMAHRDPLLLARARRCRRSRGRIPNFVTGDFCETGDLFAAFAALDADGP